jgi:outer membrane biosynthesis protein TonB
MALEQRHRDEERRQRRAFRLGLLVSAVAHALLLLSFGGQALPPSPYAAAGERARDIRAAQGSGLEAVQLQTPERLTVPPVPIPIPDPDPVDPDPVEPEPDVVLDEVPAIALAEGTALPGEAGTRPDPGLPNATGQGDGGTEADGRFRVVPPRPRGVTLPPGDRPADVRGKEVEVWVFVASTGEVVADSTRLHPSTGDRRFDRRLREHAAAWVFEAARRDGRAVAEWFRYTIIM